MKRLWLLPACLFLLAALGFGQVTITTPTLPDGYIDGIFYSQTIGATLSPPVSTVNATLTWSVSTGTLPPGLTLNTTTGALTGNPTVPGVYNFTVLVQINFTGYTDQRQYTLSIDTPTISIVSTSPLPNVALGENYQVVLQAMSAPALTVQWTVSPNALPPGLLMSPQGIITGIPQTVGTYSFSVGAYLANTGVVASKMFSIQVFSGRLQITSPSPLPTATVGQPYNYMLTSLPGAGVTWGSPVSLPGITLDPATGILSGTPPITGNFFFVISASAPGFTPDSKTFNFFVISGPLSITDTSLPLAILSAPYSAQVHATGGLAPYLWRLTGTPPPGLSIDLNTGILSGRPTAVGPYNFAIQATDATGTMYARFFNLFVAGPVTIISSSLPNGVAGVAYNQTLSAGGGQAPYTWSIISGNIPPGIQFSPAGTLIGTPTRNGFFQFTVQVSDNGQRTASLILSITVGGIAISTPSLPDAGFGAVYLQNLQVAGGNAPYNWVLVGGSLPPGLMFNSAGTIQGTPTQTGSFQFTVQVTDATQTTSQKQFTLNVATPLQLITASLPTIGINGAYSQTLSATGGSPPYNFTVELGSLPPGLALNAATGVISGTTTVPGSYTFGVLLTDQGVQQVHKTFTIAVTSPILITTGSLNGVVSAAYSHTFTATGGTAPYTWSIASGSLPAGLTLNPSTGVISGTPTTTGTYAIAVGVTDAKNLSTQQPFTIIINLTAAPSAAIGLSPDTSAPAQQPQVTISLANAYAADINVTLTVAFQSSVGGDDQSIRFSNGTRTLTFTIPAGSTQASPGNLLTGTVAGTITLTADLQSGGTDITPSPAPTKTVVIGPSVPVISSVSFQTSGTTLTVTVTGYSTTRDMVSGLFHFAPATGSILAQTDFTEQLASAFATWYNNTASNATGSQFVLTAPFTISQGSPVSITAVTVTLTNSQGGSVPVSP